MDDEIDVGYEEWDEEPPMCCGSCGAEVEDDEWECWYCGADLP